MIMDENTYGDEIIQQHWHIDGPHDEHTTMQAGNALAELIRFLNHATGPGHRQSAMQNAAVANRTINYLHSAVAGMPQLLAQLARFLEEQADDPSLYDDRRRTQGAPTGTATALNAAVELRSAVTPVKVVQDALNKALRHTTHLGNDDRPLHPVPEQDWSAGEDLG